MLYVFKEKSRSITGVECKEGALYLYSELATHRLVPYTEKCVRISYTYEEKFSEKKKPGSGEFLYYNDRGDRRWSIPLSICICF